MKSKVLLVSLVCLSCLVAQVLSTGLLTKALVMKKAAVVGLGALAAKKAAVVGLGAVAAKKVAATLALKGLAAVVKKGVALKGAALAAARGAVLANSALLTPPFFPSRLQIIQPYPYQFYNPFFMPYNQMPFLRPYKLPSQKLESPEEDRPNSERNIDVDAPEKKNNEVKTPKTRAAMQNNGMSSDYEILKFE